MSSGASSSGTRGGGDRSKGKGRAGHHGGRMGRPRRAADYTPAVEPRANQAAIEEAARMAVERAGAAGLDDGDSDDQSSCYICAEPVKYWVLGTCSHRTCHVCSLRLRALYKKRECTFCKVDLPTVVCTTAFTTSFQDFPPDAFPYADAKLGIAFETSEMMEDTLTLLRYNCPQVDCDYLGNGWADLHRHVRHVHELQFCDLCTRYQKIFTHEHSLFSQHDLLVHVKDGDPLPTSYADADQTGFTGHPVCEFCRITFYDNDQLFVHCRDKHEQCFICLRNGTGRYQYYLDYPHLETHFQTTHHLCLNSNCLEQRFVAFESEIDLQAHQIATHGSTSGSRMARRVETNFSYAPSQSLRVAGAVSMQPRRRSPQALASSSRNVGPGHLVGADSVEEAAAGPKISGVLSSKGKTIPGLLRGGFNTTLSEDADIARKANRKPLGDGSNMAETVTGIKQTDPVMAVRHASLLSSVHEAVNGSDSKTSAFRAAVRAYRASETSADDLIKTIHSLLDEQTYLSGRIISSTADLLDSADKRNDLLSTWNDHPLSQDANLFPSLVPIAPMSHGSTIRESDIRPAIRPRSSVPKSQKTGNAAMWARIADAAANKNVGAVPGLTTRVQINKEKFPSLSSAEHAVSSGAVRGATPWASTRQQATSPGSTYFPVAASAVSTSLSSLPVPGKPSPRVKAPSNEFPSLPAALAARSRGLQRTGLSGSNPTAGSMRWGTSSPPWNTASLAGTPPAPTMVELGDHLQDIDFKGQSSGGKKKGKQVLLHYGR